MKNKLTELYDLKYEYEKIYQEYELMLMDDKPGKYLFAFIIQQMAELRLGIRIIENEIIKKMEEEE